MWFFLLHQGSWTPNEVLNYAFGNKIPITSVRRAMTDLTNDGKLIKTKFKRLGSFGRMVYTWTLPDGDI